MLLVQFCWALNHSAVPSELNHQFPAACRPAGLKGLVHYEEVLGLFISYLTLKWADPPLTGTNAPLQTVYHHNAETGTFPHCRGLIFMYFYSNYMAVFGFLKCPVPPPFPPVGAFHPWLQIKLSDCQHFPELLRTKSTSKQKIKFPAESWRGCKINTMLEAFGCRCHNVLIIVGGVCTAACLQVFFSLSVCLARFGWRRIIFCNVLTAWTSKHSSQHLV